MWGGSGGREVEGMVYEGGWVVGSKWTLRKYKDWGVRVSWVYSTLGESIIPLPFPSPYREVTTAGHRRVFIRVDHAYTPPAILPLSQ